jgi:hypothetical protein
MACAPSKYTHEENERISFLTIFVFALVVINLCCFRPAQAATLGPDAGLSAPNVSASASGTFELSSNPPNPAQASCQSTGAPCGALVADPTSSAAASAVFANYLSNPVSVDPSVSAYASSSQTVIGPGAEAFVSYQFLVSFPTSSPSALVPFAIDLTATGSTSQTNSPTAAVPAALAYLWIYNGNQLVFEACAGSTGSTTNSACDGRQAKSSFSLSNLQIAILPNTAYTVVLTAEASIYNSALDQNAIDASATASAEIDPIISIDPATLAQNPDAQLFLSQSVDAVPEPSTWAMLLIGFAGMGFAAYRRHQLPNPAGTVSA